jgi:adenine-specific DNA methylase
MALPDQGQTLRKARGAFFTPPEIASFLVDWAIRHADDVVLEPSCGEAAFIVSVFDRLLALRAAPPTADQLHGVDIHEQSVSLASEALAAVGGTASLTVANFFDYRATSRFDAVVGNPPYVRYQSFVGESRTKAQEAALAQGVRLGALASSWAPFTVHAASFLKPEGRLALVLPAELLSVNYAAPVRRYLMNRFRRVRLVLFDERVFPGVQEEVVLLLAEGQGPTDHCELVQAKNAGALTALTPHTWTPANVEDKWTAGLLTANAAEIYQRMLNSGGIESLQAWGETNLGMVTGNNRFFTLNAAAAKELKLKAAELLHICPPGSRHLRGLGFADRAWKDMRDEGARVYLFDPSEKNVSAEALAYIRHGESAGVHNAYKCRVREPWWRVPRVQVPDAFLTYMNADTPRIVTNRSGVAYLNSVHGITYVDDRRQIAMDLLPIASLNSVTLLGSELVGRSYGGGMLKLEPKEGDRLPVPALSIVQAAADDLRALRPQLLGLLRRGKLLSVVARVDRVLRRQLGLKTQELEILRAARKTLSGRRASRARNDP